MHPCPCMRHVQDAGQPCEAEALFRRALSGVAANFGPGHPAAVNVSILVAGALKAQVWHTGCGSRCGGVA
eukprot:363181-Chlamydomonas_euryale.AAC.9